MTLTPPFIKKNVLPGEPVTAQAWNDIVDALGAVYAYIDASDTASVSVQITNADVDRATVRVTATRNDNNISSEAVAPVAPSTLHVFAELKPGVYTLRAEAPGFTPFTGPLTVQASGTVATQNVTLAKAGAFMPLTFGVSLKQALQQLAALPIAVNNIIDVTGVAVPPAHPEPRHLDALVLMQFPPAGTPMGAGQSAQLVISAALETLPSIEMPSLTGLTLAEATKALEQLGLKVGTASTKTTTTTGTGTGPVNIFTGGTAEVL